MLKGFTYWGNSLQSFNMVDIRPFMTSVDGCREFKLESSVFYAVDCSSQFKEDGTIEDGMGGISRALSWTNDVLKEDSEEYKEQMFKRLSDTVARYVANKLEMREGSDVYCTRPYTQLNGDYDTELHVDATDATELLEKEQHRLYEKVDPGLYVNLKSVTFWAVLNSKKEKVENNVLGIKGDENMMFMDEASIGAFYLYDGTALLHGNVVLSENKLKAQKSLQRNTRKSIELKCFYDGKIN